MTTMLVPVDHGEALPGLLESDRYVLPPALPFERWQQIGVTLQQMHRSINWWIGDWLAYGEDHYGEDAYQAVQEITGRGDESLGQTVWIARTYPPHLRIDGVSWTHHRTVADLDPVERSELLLTAAREGWSTRVLRDEVERRERTVQAETLAGASAPETGCAVDTCEGLTVQDLTADARAALHRIAHDQRVPAGMAGRVFVAALIWAGALDCFTREPGT